MPGVLVTARKAAGAFARRREEPDPKAVAGPRVDLDEPLAGSTFKELTRGKRSRTTNAIERHLGEAGRGPPWASSPTAPASKGSFLPSSTTKSTNPGVSASFPVAGNAWHYRTPAGSRQPQLRTEYLDVASRTL